VTPTWYDLLGVEPDASADEIRAAWKAEIADLEPGDRKFRALNEAAEVLLDKERRAAYDATLESEADPQTEVAPPLTRPKLSERVQRATTVSDGSGETEAQLEAPSPTQEEQDSRTATRLKVPAWLLAGLAVVVAILLGTAGYLVTQPSDDSIASGTSDAQGAAERAATTILAYDYRHLDEDQKAAGALMTPAYQKKYDELFTQIAENAPDVKAIVTADVVASGIVRSGADRVQVLVFVNRPTLRADKTEPTVFRDQVVMTMEKSGDDWLVDNMDTNQLAG
jgi:Mce-associated membrane protein